MSVIVQGTNLQETRQNPLANLACEPVASVAQRVLVNVEQAAMRYGQRQLWQDVSFGISTGEFVALLGANGTGKTTLLKAILGNFPLTAGRITRADKLTLGYVPQLKDFDPKLPLRGRDLIQLGLDGGNYLFGFFQPKKPLGRYWLSVKQKNYRIDKAIDEVGGKAFANAPLSMLSGGEQQRMRIAQALVSEPDLLLMDEPLLSLDVASQQIVGEILAHRKATHRTAILMISHEIMPILPLIDKVVLLQNGIANIGGRELVTMSAFG